MVRELATCKKLGLSSFGSTGESCQGIVRLLLRMPLLCVSQSSGPAMKFLGALDRSCRMKGSLTLGGLHSTGLKLRCLGFMCPYLVG